MGTLFVVATPIGNLEDLSPRAEKVLRAVDTILCEDTRTSKVLLSRFGIGTPLVSYHQHSRLGKMEWVTAQLREGKNLALISDAGTPGVADPGNKMVAHVIDSLGQGVHVVPIPGPNAALAAASVAGISMDRFVFLGFPPHKKGRQTFLRRALSHDIPVILYESPHRVLKALEFIASEPNGTSRHLVVARELTKLHEEILRGSATDILNLFTAHPDKIRGEFVIIITTEKNRAASE